jgi:hypothetical protein
MTLTKVFTVADEMGIGSSGPMTMEQAIAYLAAKTLFYPHKRAFVWEAEFDYETHKLTVLRSRTDCTDQMKG